MGILVKDLPNEIKELFHKEAGKLKYNENSRVSEVFSWGATQDGGSFWSNIDNGDFTKFYKRYPEKLEDPFKLINCVKSGSTIIYYGKVKGRKVKIEITYE